MDEKENKKVLSESFRLEYSRGYNSNKSRVIVNDIFIFQSQIKICPKSLNKIMYITYLPNSVCKIDKSPIYDAIHSDFLSTCKQI